MDVATPTAERASTGLRRPDPCALVIFGASGDLTKRLLVPALYNLAVANLLPERFAVIGVARQPLSDDAFRQNLAEALRERATAKVDPAIADDLLARFSYVHGDLGHPVTYGRLRQALAAADRNLGSIHNHLFYLATPPHVFAPVARHLHEAGLASETDGWRRIVIEKPFGTSLESAKKLNRELLSLFAEHQIFRIDHYLGKETVQNILVLRFANGLFEPLWNRNHIDHVQITVAETVDVGTRGKFYEGTGALRDMVPNHLFQLLALTAMEPPTAFEADPVRDEKAKAIRAIHPLDLKTISENVVRAQYRAGSIGDRQVGAYRDAAGVDPQSNTESYVALSLMIDNWRWAGVPFCLRTGKALAARRTEIVVKFKDAPTALFRDTPVDRLAKNMLVLRIQPNEGAALQFNAKIPGPVIRTEGVRMDFRYQDYFDAAPSTGYETLIYDCMIGDPILFQRADEIELSWQVVQPILDAWRERGSGDLAWYDAGTDGPEAAAEIVARCGDRWRKVA